MVWYSWFGFLGLALGLGLNGIASQSWQRSAIAGLAIGVAVTLLMGYLSPCKTTAAGVQGFIEAYILCHAWVTPFCLVIGVVVGFVGSTPLRGAAAGLVCGLVALFIANAIAKDGAPCLQNAKGSIDILRAYTICR